MNLELIILFFLISFTVIFLPGYLRERRRLLKLSSPVCAGFSWRRSFPEAKKQDLRVFNQIIQAAFGHSERFYLRFSPDVKVLDIYRAGGIYWFGMEVDNLEMETFCLLIEEHFEVDLDSVWDEELTLSNVFTMIQASR